IADQALKVHPLAIWTETRLGITTTDANPAWHRARPRTLDEAARELAAEAGRDEEVCKDALRRLLLVSSLPEADRTGDDSGSHRSFFAFKLHQFISGAGHAFATLEPPGVRKVTVEGQQFLPGDPEKRLYPVHFCRECGHEYHPVRFVSEDGERKFLARDIDDAAPAKSDDESEGEDEESSDREVFGFITLHARDAEFTFADREEDYPETWLEFDAAGNPRIKSHYRAARARQVTVAPNGHVGSRVTAGCLH